MARTIIDILQMKSREKITMLTAYDYQMAAILDQAGIDVLLVGDSMGNIVYGAPNTLSVTVNDIIRHSQAVSKAAQNALVVADMPFGSYQPSLEIAVTNASRFLGEGAAHAVKLEGGTSIADTIHRLVEVGIPVMGHVGLTPQSVHQLGGYKMQGKTEAQADRIVRDALAVEQAGAFSVVLECVQPDVAKEITQRLKIPTIGIGSGSDCDGQVLVSNDFLGLTVGHIPKFVKPALNLRSIISEATQSFILNVKGKK